MHRPTSVLVAAAAAIVVMAGCGGDDASDSTATRPSTATTAPVGSTGPTDTGPTDTEPTDTEPDGGEIPAELAGVRWVLDGTYTVAGLQPLPAPTEAGFTIDADGTMAIDTGCNQGSATVTVDGDELTVGPITVTERACTDEAVMQIEQILLGQLAEPQTWSVNGSDLNLFAANISDTGMSLRDGAVPPPTDPAPSTSTGG